MNVFEAVKDSVTAREAAQMYGIKVDRSGKALCPFQNDRHPSMKLDKRFHCFACQADGDVIDFVSRYFNISAVDAAKKLAEDFHIFYDDQPENNSTSMKSQTKMKISDRQQFKEIESYCYRVLCDYLRLLEKWKEEYAPRTPEEEWHPCFIEALQKESYIEYLLDDILLNGTLQDKADFILDYGKEVTKIERRIREFTAGKEGSCDADDKGNAGVEEDDRSDSCRAGTIGGSVTGDTAANTTDDNTTAFSSTV